MLTHSDGVHGFIGVNRDMPGGEDECGGSGDIYVDECLCAPSGGTNKFVHMWSCKQKAIEKKNEEQ